MNVRKRATAFVMCILMIMTLLPFGAFADGTGDVVYGRYDENGSWVQDANENGVHTEGNIVTKKIATPLGNDEYQIDLSVAYTTTKTAVHAGSAATVLVLDTSGSMNYCAECGGDKYHGSSCRYYSGRLSRVGSEQTRMTAAKNAAYSFLESYKGDVTGQGRYVAVVSFAGDASIACNWQDVSTEAGLVAVKSAINGLSAGGGTNTDAGLTKAASLLGQDAVSGVQAKNAVLLTDGVPTVFGSGNVHDGTDGSPYTSYCAQRAATYLKNTGAELYTVCFGATKDADKAYVPNANNKNEGRVTATAFLATYIASEGKAYSAADTDALNKAFDAITKEIVDGITTGMVVNDSETEFVKMTSVPEAYTETENGYAWTLSDPVVTTSGDQTTYTYSVSYTVKLDTAKDGFVEGKYYPTNGVTTLHYKDADGNDQSIDFTVPGVKGELPAYSVSYRYDGTFIPDGANDQLPASANHKKGTTVSVAGAPSVAGYVFSGWTTSDAEVTDGSFTMPNKQVEFVGTWAKRSDLTYTVNYYLNGTTTTVAESKTVTDKTLGEVVTESPISVGGYTALPDQDGTITIAVEGNVINFYYYKNVTVTAKSSTFTYDGEEHSVRGFTCSDENASFDLTVGATGTNVGEYPAEFAEGTVGTVDASKTCIITKANDGKLTIDPIDTVTVTIEGNTDTVKYDGTEQSVTGYTVSIDNDLYKETDFSFTGNAIAKGTDADTYNMNLDKDQFVNNNKNFKNVVFVVEDGSLTITKAEVKFAGGNKIAVYDGTEKSVSNITATGLIDGHTYSELTYIAKGTDAGSYKGAFSGDVVIKDAEGNDVTKNYTVETEPGQLVISPVSDKVIVTITGSNKTVDYDGTEQSVTGYTVSIENDLYKEADFSFTGNATAKGTDADTYNIGLAAKDFKNISNNFTDVVFVVNDGYITINPATVTVKADNQSKVYGEADPELTATVSGLIGDNTVTYEIDRDEGENVGTYAIKPSGETTQGNYVVTYENGTLTITAAGTLTVAGENYNGVYDGEAHGESAKASVTEGTTISYKVGEGDWTSEAPTITDVGSVKVSVKAENPNYKTAEAEYTLTVTPATVTVKADNQRKVYGEADPTFTATVSGLIGDNTVTYGISRDEGEDVGDYTITPTGDKEQGNYTVEYENGTLTITAAGTLTVAGENYKGVYDGKAHGESATASVTEGTTISYKVGEGEWTTEAPTITNVGSVKVSVKAENPNYKTAEAEYTLTVTPATVTFTGESKTVTYNGTEQSITGITDSGLISGHTYSELTYAAKGTDAGSYDGAFTGTAVINDAEGNDATKNYTVKTKIGQLTIDPVSTKVTVTITGNTDTVKYDGDEHTVSGYTYEASNGLYTNKDFSFTGDATEKGTGADTYKMGLGKAQFANNSKNFTEVEFIVNDGSLVIEKRVVKLTSASDEKTYDGKPLTNDTVTVSGDGFVKSDAVVCDVTGTQTATGSSENEFTYEAKDNTNLANYEITTEFGILAVKQLLETDEHFNYVIGYPDGTIRPEGKITRAEVATIFFRLLTDDARAEFDSTENSFKDVAAGSWYNRAISTLANANILIGDEKGNFRPNDSITRAEMATIIARFDKLTETGKTFSDIKGHWAQEAIEMAATKGWLDGYPDGTFLPNNAITRAETFKIINSVLNRKVNSQDDLLVDEMNVWKDNMDPAAWYYYHVQEATNNHKCERIDMSEYERWTEKLPDIDWASYQF